MGNIANEILSICNDVTDRENSKYVLALLAFNSPYIFGLRKLIVSVHIYIDHYYEKFFFVSFQL